MTHNTLHNFYEVNFALSEKHHWDIMSIENLIVYERDIYLTLLKNSGGGTEGDRHNLTDDDKELIAKVLEQRKKIE